MDTLHASIPQTKAAKEAAYSVLQMLREQWDLGGGSERLITPEQLRAWCRRNELTPSQMEPLLKRFESSGLITSFEFFEGQWSEDESPETVLKFEFHPAFAEIYISYKGQLSLGAEGDIEVQTKYGLLKLNKLTGNFALNDVKGALNPSSKEFRVLLTLITAPGHTATYKELIGGEVTKESKRFLSFTIRRLKGQFGILSKKGAKNGNIFENLKKFGFRLPE